MNIRSGEVLWLDEQGVCSFEHLLEVSGLSASQMRELVEAGVIAPQDPAARPPRFSLHYMVTARTAGRLLQDFELDQNGLLLALTLLRRIETLEQALSTARARGPETPTGEAHGNHAGSF